MRILHIISSGGMYGAEAVILNMSRMLNASGHASMLGVFANSANPNLQLHEATKREGIESHLIPCSGQVDGGVGGRIWDLVVETGADVVHAHGYKADIYGYLALRGRGVGLVSTCHNWLNDGLLVAFYGVADRLVLRGFDGVVAVSEEVRETLVRSGVKAEKVRLIRNGIDLRPFDRADPVLRREEGLANRLLVGIVGRLSVEKGMDIFLRAAAEVVKEVPEAAFVIAGDGPEREPLEALVDSLELRDCVTLLGRREDMPGIYASMDVLVSASRKEGLPMTILEGMASCRPWVATAVGAVPTVVRDGETGVLVASGDVSGLAAAVVSLLRDKERRLALGGAGRRLVEQEFSAQRMTEDYLSLYEAVLGKAKPGLGGGR